MLLFRHGQSSPLLSLSFSYLHTTINRPILQAKGQRSSYSSPKILPYIIFAQNKYREHIRPHELEKEQFNEGRALGVLDKMVAI